MVAIGVQFVARNTVFNWEVGTDCHANAFQNHSREADSIFHGTAIFVGTVVVDRRQESAKQPTVSAVNHYHVKTAALADRTCFRKVVGNLVHFGISHFLKFDAVITFPVGGTQNNTGAIQFRGSPDTAGTKFNISFGTILMNGVRHIVQSHTSFFPPNVDLGKMGFAVFPVDSSLAHCDDTSSAFGAIAIVGNKMIGGITLLVNHGNYRGRGFNTVFHCHLADLNGRKQCRIELFHEITSFYNCQYRTVNRTHHRNLW